MYKKKKSRYNHKEDRESYLSPGTCHPLRGRAALQVTAHPGGGSAMFGALGLWQVVTALPALTQDHAVPVAGTTAGRTLRTEREMKKERGGKKHEAGDGGDGRVQQGVTAVISVQKEIFSLRSAEGSSRTRSQEPRSCKSAGHNSSCVCVCVCKTSELKLNTAALLTPLHFNLS